MGSYKSKKYQTLLSYQNKDKNYEKFKIVSCHPNSLDFYHSYYILFEYPLKSKIILILVQFPFIPLNFILVKKIV